MAASRAGDEAPVTGHQHSLAAESTRGVAVICLGACRLTHVSRSDVVVGCDLAAALLRGCARMLVRL